MDNNELPPEDDNNYLPYVALVWGLGHLIWLFLYMNPFS